MAKGPKAKKPRALQVVEVQFKVHGDTQGVKQVVLTRGELAAWRKKTKGKVYDVKVINPGSGAFKRCVKKVAAGGSAADPAAVCAAAGRKKYGRTKFAAMGAAGRRAAKKNAGAGSVRKTGKSKGGRPRRSNPEAEAAERYEYFHGRPPEEVVTVTERVHEHDVLSGIGKLISLSILAVDGRHEITLKNFGGALLSQDEKGTQLFITGGDQKVNLKDFGIRGTPHEQEILGAARSIVYDTQKDHLGAEGGKAQYVHKFGKKDKRLPIIGYRTRDKRLEFWGGGYDLPEVGIRG